MQRRAIFIIILLVIFVSSCKGEGYTTKDIQNSPPPSNPSNTIDTSVGTHLWIMDSCAGDNINSQFTANNFDVFVVGDYHEGTFRWNNVHSYVGAVKAIKPEAKFTYYSNFQQLLWDEPELNLDEKNFLHNTDPASLTLVPRNNAILIDWTEDRRYEHSPFPVSSYNVYRSIDNVNFNVIQNTANTEYLDTNVVNGQIYYYKIKTISNSVEYDFSYVNSATPTATPPSYYLTSGFVDWINRDIPNRVYNYRFRVKPSSAGDSAFIYMDLNADWSFNDLDERRQLIWNPVTGEYELDIIIDLDNYRSLQPGALIVFGFTYYFEVNKSGQSYYMPQNALTGNYYTTSANNRLRHRKYGNYWHSVKSQSWRNLFIQHAQETMSLHYLDGVYIDEPRIPNIRYYNDGQPKDITQAEHDQYVNQFATELRSALPNALLFYNSLDVVNLNDEGLDGGLVEGYGTYWPDYYDLNTWLTHQNSIIGSETSGIAFMLPVIGSQPEIDIQRRLFTLASYYLVKGDGSYFWVKGWGCPTQSSIYPELIDNTNINLGTAIGAYPLSINSLKFGTTNLYVKQFEKGVVIVNPSLTPYDYNIGSIPYKEVQISGNNVILASVPSIINVPANTGKILIEASVPLPTCTLTNAVIRKQDGTIYNNGTDVNAGTIIKLEVDPNNCPGKILKFEIHDVDNGILDPELLGLTIQTQAIQGDNVVSINWNVVYREDLDDMIEDGQAPDADNGLEYKFNVSVLSENIAIESSNWIDVINVTGGPPGGGGIGGPAGGGGALSTCQNTNFDVGQEQCDPTATPSGCSNNGMCSVDCNTCYYETQDIVTLVTRGECIDDNDGDNFGEYEEISRTINKTDQTQLGSSSAKKECYLAKEVEIPFFDRISLIVSVILLTLYYAFRRFSGQKHA